MAKTPPPEPSRSELLKGTLDMLILQTLTVQPMHGYAIAQHIGRLSEDVLSVEQGSLYPALHRMERRGWVASEWGLSENNRRAKYYLLTPQGREQLREQSNGWQRLAAAVTKAITTTTAPTAPSPAR